MATTDRRIFSWDEVDSVSWDEDGLGAQILSGEQMHLIRAVYRPGAIYEMHSHPHEQFSLLLSGRLLLTVGDETREIAAGDGWYAPSDVPHGGVVVGDEEAVFIDVYSPATAWILGVLETARHVPAAGSSAPD
ncbi:MAG: cupin domain-containing protein [Acidimicrobiales bacterium]